jgi:predicted Zn-dependent protease
MTLNTAQGFFRLEMWDDAWAELGRLEPKFRLDSRVIMLRVLILNNREKWEEAAIMGREALRHYPDFGALYLATGHALRNCKGPAEARAMIASGEPYLENEAVFHYMLACYDSALGNLDDAKEALACAFELENGFRLKALDELDLAPLWDSLGEF